jgi:hypothetical protein
MAKPSYLDSDAKGYYDPDLDQVVSEVPVVSPGQGHYLGKIVYNFDAKNWSHAPAANNSTTWKQWPTTLWDQHTGFTGGSILQFNFYIPTRMDTANWGGAYIEPNLSWDNGTTWYGLGNTGYDGGVMIQTGYAIHNHTQEILVTDTPTTDYNVRVRFMVKTYDNTGTLYINQSHDINRTGTSGYSTGDNRLSGISSNQFYGSYRIYEWIPIS